MKAAFWGLLFGDAPPARREQIVGSATVTAMIHINFAWHRQPAYVFGNVSDYAPLIHLPVGSNGR
jgi:hypothetical protein